MILVISKSKRNAARVAESLNTMGYLAYGVAPGSALQEISPRYRAILISNCDEIVGLDIFLNNLSASPLNIPMFAIGNENRQGISEIYSPTLMLTTVIKKITRYLVINELPVIGRYKCAGFDCSSELRDVYYFDKRLSLTKTEKMIFRFLCRAYPLGVSAKDIIQYAIRPSHSPEPATIRTHISKMNRKFRAELSRKIIEFSDFGGYVIITPENRREILK